MAKLNIAAQQHESRLMAGFSRQEKETFFQLLRRADANLSHNVAEVQDVALWIPV